MFEGAYKTHWTTTWRTRHGRGGGLGVAVLTLFGYLYAFHSRIRTLPDDSMLSWSGMKQKYSRSSLAIINNFSEPNLREYLLS